MVFLDVLAQATPTAQAAVDTAIRDNQSNWLIILIFFQLIIGLAVSMMFIPMLFRPNNPSATKGMAYESGMPP
ncbi:MAG TPA: hypothetical protein VGE04_16615, partial [Chloroflexia bacterium]